MVGKGKRFYFAFGYNPVYFSLCYRFLFYFCRLLAFNKNLPGCGFGVDYRCADAGAALAGESTFFCKVGWLFAALCGGNDFSLGKRFLKKKAGFFTGLFLLLRNVRLLAFALQRVENPFAQAQAFRRHFQKLVSLNI